jgi:hypothetical protein
MHDKSQTETSSAGNVPSQHSFPQTFDKNEQPRTDTSSQRIEPASSSIARNWREDGMSLFPGFVIKSANAPKILCPT